MKKISLCLLSAVLFASCSQQDDCSDEKMRLQQRIASLEDSVRMLRGNASGMTASNTTESGTTETSTTNSGTTTTTTGNTSGSSASSTAKPKTTRSLYREGSKRTVYRSAKGTPGQFPEGTDKQLTDNDLKFMSDWGLDVMKNEIYARHGMIFTDPDLRAHFAEESWYHGRSRNVMAQLTSTERQNISTIDAHKEQKDSKY